MESSGEAPGSTDGGEEPQRGDTQENPLVVWRRTQRQSHWVPPALDGGKVLGDDDLRDLPGEEALSHLEGHVAKGWTDAAGRIAE